ncbi:MAG: glycoside hydrolase [Bacteroidetes bacterium HGW-Bacteroidetes-15]|nr:MAG: glycoside hydrolase [Bacteroidetes bacterium HGW-Bacteroidetes-15]
MYVFSLLVIVLFSSCDDSKISTDDPANLVVEITLPIDGSGLITIQAQADNAIEYQLLIGSSDIPVVTNSTGTFEYTFLQTGYYQVEVRAYGSSGRYIKDVRQISLTIGNGVSTEDGYTSPLTYDGYSLVWNDEFDGTTINSSNWVFEIGTGNSGWGNNELQYYRQENAWIEEGVLTIEARKENYSGSNYTSSRMKTQNKLSFQYGRIDIRALLPKGQGIWPALWMLGNSITSVGWPQCGEIDIMEMIGGSGRENQTHGTVHWDNNGHIYVGGTYTKQTGTFADEYHVFSIIWNQTSIKWLVNNNQFYEIDITPAHMTEFHQKHFFIFNVAVGGNWPGSPDATTIFPQQMKVDYIRVFQ